MWFFSKDEKYFINSDNVNYLFKPFIQYSYTNNVSKPIDIRILANMKDDGGRDFEIDNDPNIVIIAKFELDEMDEAMEYWVNLCDKLSN